MYCERCGKNSEDKHFCKECLSRFKKYKENKDKQSEERCIICNDKIKNLGWKYLCSECYITALEECKEFKNSNHKTKDYVQEYNEIYNDALETTNFKEIKENCASLVAIAKACERYGDHFPEVLANKVEEDINELIFKSYTKKCIICEKYSGRHDLCYECYTEIKSVEDFGYEETQLEESNDDISCLICGKNSNNKHFCTSCYHSYKKKTILLKINKLSTPCGEPLDESYEGIYPANDGHVVKSMAERDIDDYLFNKNIKHGYETLLDIGEEEPLRPDFCLKEYLGKDKDVYIEYFGMKGDPEYDKKTEYKMYHYRKKKITLICLYPEDNKNGWDYTLTKILITDKNKIEINKINRER